MENALLFSDSFSVRMTLDTYRSRSVMHVLDNAGLYNPGPIMYKSRKFRAIFSIILRFFYMISLSITRII